MYTIITGFTKLWLGSRMSSKVIKINVCLNAAVYKCFGSSYCLVISYADHQLGNRCPDYVGTYRDIYKQEPIFIGKLKHG